MFSEESSWVPKARVTELIVRKFGDETLVYDLERDKDHCLSQSAASVWERCDGKTQIKDLASAMEPGSGRKEELLWLALEELQEARLLEGELKTPEGSSPLSRREVIRKMARAAAVAGPLVTSIVVTRVAACDITEDPPQGAPSPGFPSGPGRGRR